MKFTGIIPARYASTRFPGKPLADMGGKPMIQRVYEQAVKTVDNLYVATDDERIVAAVENFGGKAIMTSDTHHSGTERCYEACCRAGIETGIIINIQGDEPFIQPEQILLLKDCFTAGGIQIATLATPITDDEAGAETLYNPNAPKVVLNKRGEAMYFSRETIPYLRDISVMEWHSRHTYYKHIGLYAYRIDILREITQLSPSVLEQAEKLEQLRWLENGYKIKVAITHRDTVGIDTPEDLVKANAMFHCQ